MTAVKITIDAKDTQRFLVRITGEITNRRGLNAVLAATLADDLREHFGRKNSAPNRMGAPKTGFWNEMAAATGVTQVTDTGATVTVAEQRFAIHLFGGTIVPKIARFLTIPLIAAARGKRVADYERDTGHRLVRIGNILADKSSAAATVRGGRGVSLASSGATPVYLLAKRAVIKKDPAAIPPMETLAASLQQAANDYVTTLAN